MTKTRKTRRDGASLANLTERPSVPVTLGEWERVTTRDASPDGSPSAGFYRPPMSADPRPFYGPTGTEGRTRGTIPTRTRPVRKVVRHNPAEWERHAATRCRDTGTSVESLAHAAGVSPDELRKLRAMTLRQAAEYLANPDRTRTEPRHRVSDDWSAVARWMGEESPKVRDMPREALPVPVTECTKYNPAKHGDGSLDLPTDGPGSRAMLGMRTADLLGWAIRSDGRDYSAPRNPARIRPEVSPRVTASPRYGDRVDAGVPKDRKNPRRWGTGPAVTGNPATYLPGKVVRDTPRITPENPYRPDVKPRTKPAKLSPRERAMRKLYGFSMRP